MTTQSPKKKAWERRMLYPTARHFDDLFSAGQPCVDDSYPHGWPKPWVTEIIDQDKGSHKLGHIQIGPYCHVEEGKPLWVNARDHLVKTIKSKLPSVEQDIIFFDIIHHGADAVVFARYNIAKIRRLVAKIDWESVPCQETVVLEKPT
jgi:hypothetical protein